MNDDEHEHEHERGRSEGELGDEPGGGGDGSAGVMGAPADAGDGERAGDAVAKVYYADDQPVELYAAFIIEGWDWVIGFDQVGTAAYDYVSIPADRVVGVMSSRYAQFSANGRRVTGYGITDAEVREFRDLLPL